MKNLNFDTGIVSYNINDAVTVSFNPTDSNFVERLYKTFNNLDEKQDSYKAAIEKAANKKEIFDLTRKMDEEMRALLDTTLGTPVCESLFGDMNVFALSNGLPVWCNLLFAIMDEIDTAFSREQKATNPRIQKYMAKYHR